MRRGLLLDSNLAVLLVVGLTNEKYIGRHDCLAKYDRTDWLLLKELISESAGIIFTPHVITETSNLVRQIKEPIKSELSIRFAKLISDSREVMLEGRIVVLREEYPRLGFTDAALLALNKGSIALLTADTALFHAALNAKLEAVNFNYVRDRRPDFR